MPTLSSFLATAEVPPGFLEIIAAVGDKVYPVLLPIMTFGIGVAVVWFIYNSIRGAAKRKS